MKLPISTLLLLCFLQACDLVKEEEDCPAIWTLERQDEGQIRTSDVGLNMRIDNPEAEGAIRFYQAAEDYATFAPGILRFDLYFQDFFAGDNESFDGYFSASIVYATNPEQVLYKIVMKEMEVSTWVGSNFQTRSLWNRQSRGRIYFGLDGQRGDLYYLPTDETQKLEGSGMLELTNEPLMFIIEMGGSANSGPQSSRVEITLSDFATQGYGDLLSDSFNCLSVK